jgi:hypothetical protein
MPACVEDGPSVSAGWDGATRCGGEPRDAWSVVGAQAAGAGDTVQLVVEGRQVGRQESPRRACVQSARAVPDTAPLITARAPLLANSRRGSGPLGWGAGASVGCCVGCCWVLTSPPDVGVGHDDGGGEGKPRNPRPHRDGACVSRCKTRAPTWSRGCQRDGPRKAASDRAGFDCRSGT